MSNYLLIENDTEMVPEALYLMGASSKRDDSSKIGFFGSGNKYALALLLREQIPFRIFSGEREIIVTTEPVIMRNVTYDKILIDGRETSLTVQMGPQWEPWYIIRELYCNAIDEGNVRIMLDVEQPLVQGSEGKTRFYISRTSAILTIIHNWNEYFCFDREDLLFGIDGDSVFPNISGDNRILIYRKGILVYDNSNPALFSYDINDLSINESRVLTNTYGATNAIAKLWLKCGIVSLVQSLLEKIHRHNLNGTDKKKSDSLESSCGWYSADHHMNMPVWREAIGTRVVINHSQSGRFIDDYRNNCLILSESMCNAIANKLRDVKVLGVGDYDPDKDYVSISETDLQPRTGFKLKKTIKELEDMGVIISSTVRIVRFVNITCKMEVLEGVIYISEEVVNNGGIRDIAMLLIRGNLCVQNGYQNNSPEMCETLLKEWISDRELRSGIFL